MKDKEYLELISGIIYQFIVLLAVIIINIVHLVIFKALNDFLIGALVGVMIGLPMAYQSKSNKEEK